MFKDFEVLKESLFVMKSSTNSLPVISNSPDQQRDSDLFLFIIPIVIIPRACWVYIK